MLIPVTLTGCSRESIYHHQYFYFGTLIDVTIRSKDKPNVNKAFKTLENQFARMHKDWHAWKPGKLNDLNQQLPSMQPIPLTLELEYLIRQSQKISAQTNQLFNPALGKLISHWGFHQDEPKSPSNPKTQKQLTTPQPKKPSMNDLHIENGSVRTTTPHIFLDFGGIAKGYALRLTADYLISKGERHFIINAGGDLIAYGSHPNRPWKIGIRDPAGDRTLASIEPKDGESIFSSGNYERYYLQNGIKRHHIIDPRTGKPSIEAQATTVIHTDPVLADAAATALMIATDKEWLNIAGNLGIKAVLKMDAQGKIHMTKTMQKRIQLNREDLSIVLYEDPTINH